MTWRTRLAYPLRAHLLAVQFFTRVPITGRLADWVGFSPALLRASAAHFPAVGVWVGAWGAAVFAALTLCLPNATSTGGASVWVAAALSTAATVWMTGAFHEDGLADVADGLGGYVTRERALDIMKDSRLGSYGVLAVVLALLVKISLLALLGSLPVGNTWPTSATALVCVALLTAHVVSRWLPLGLIRLLPHVGDTASSKSKPLADQISGASLALGTLLPVLALALAAHVLPAKPLLLACALAGMAWLWMWRMLARRLQGFTGDALGATQQLGEIAFYLGLAMGWGL